MKMQWLITLLFAVTGGIHAQIITYPVPQQLYYARHNDDYTVSVRQVGAQDWTDLYEYNVKVDMDTRSDASMVQFDFAGKIEVQIQKNNGDVRSVDIRPLSKDIKPIVDGNFVLFTLDKPQKLSIEFNGDRLHNLHLFANAIIKDVPDKRDPKVMYFEAGYHEPDAQTKEFRIPSNTTVYLEGGAVLKGRLNCDSTENVKILGNGMLLETSNGVSANYVKNLLVDGLTVVNPRYNTLSSGVSDGITLRNIKSFSYQGWGDGLDFFCCKHVSVDNVFMRNSDDCIAVYGHRWNFYGDTKDIKVFNSTLWADIAHPINIGGHGNPDSMTGELLEDITFKNIDILEHDEDGILYQGCMTISCTDKNRVRNVLFEDIRVEHIQEGRLFNLQVCFNPKYNKQPGNSIEDVTFRNITYYGSRENPSLLEGLNETHRVQNIIFENIVIRGKKVSSLQEMNVKMNNFVDKVIVR